MTTSTQREHTAIDLSAATLGDLQTIADWLAVLHGDAVRVERAVSIALRRTIVQVGYGAFRVPGSEDGQSYLVCRGISCECSDRVKRGTYCKHLLACDIITSLGDLLTRREREQRAQAWTERQARLRVVAG